MYGGGVDDVWVFLPGDEIPRRERVEKRLLGVRRRVGGENPVLSVEDVLEDAAAEWEAGMRVTGAVTYAPRPAVDSAWARATLAALAAPRARA